MGAKKKAPLPPQRLRWERTYNNLVHLLRTKQIQLETLLRERKILECQIKTQHLRWSSVTRAAQDQIFQMKCDMAIEEDTQKLQASKSDLMAGLGHSEAVRLKLMLDYAENELAEDHKNCLDALHQKTSQSTDLTEGDNVRNSRRKGFKSGEVVAVIDKRSEVLESEIIELRAEYDKLSLKKTAEVSALLLEKDFVWHQLKALESDYAVKLKSKTDEIEKTNEKISNLIARMEELQSSNSEKDNIIKALEGKIAKMEADASAQRNEISRVNALEELQSSNSEKDNIIKALEGKIAKMEADASAQRNEISRVNQELEKLRKSSNAAVTPSLRRCSTEAGTSNMGSKNNDKSSSGIQVKKERSDPKGSNLANHYEKGSRGAKRKMIDIITIPDTPKLFSSSFKAPKLKHSSPSINTR
ncbi:hypothetical protein QQ045_030472 [Rhodiola kirilowii]